MTLALELGFTSEQAAAVRNAAFDLVDAGDLHGARALLEGLIVLNAADASAHAGLGAVLETEGHVGAAERSYDAALALDPAHPLALTNRAGLRCARGDLAARADLSRVAASASSPLRGRAQQLLKRYAR